MKRPQTAWTVSISIVLVGAFVGSRTFDSRADGQAAKLHIGTVSGAPGSSVFFTAWLETGGAEIAGLQTDLSFDPDARIASTPVGGPDCVPEAEVSDRGELTLTATYLPTGCIPGSCTGARILVLPDGMNLFSIPNGSNVFRCRAEITPLAERGSHPLVASRTYASADDGALVPTLASNGSIEVSSGGCS